MAMSFERKLIQDTPVAMGDSDDWLLENRGGGAVYYGSNSSVTPDTATGSVSTGEVTRMTGVQYLVCIRGQNADVIGKDIIPSLQGSGDGVLSAITVNSTDAEGRPTSVTEDGVTTTYTYNPDGSVATETRNGITRTYSYDAAGNLTGATVA